MPISEQGESSTFMEVPDEVEPAANATKEGDTVAAVTDRQEHKEFTDVDLCMSSPQSMRARARYGGSKTPGQIHLPKT